MLADQPEQVQARTAALDSRSAARAGAGLDVWLAFGTDADLDVFVTAPDQETVYFANSPTRLGGTLERDERCGGSAPAVVEHVGFPEPAKGRYRVGIDFPRRCDDGDAPEVFVVRIAHAGGTRDVVGVIRPGEFLLRVLEEDVESGAP